jgi:uncharacterized membrane protein
MEVVMGNIIRNSVIALMCVVSPVSSAFAASVPAEEGGSLLLTLFIGFFALIVVFQLVPACLLFVGILKGLFVRKHEVKPEATK